MSYNFMEYGKYKKEQFLLSSSDAHFAHNLVYLNCHITYRIMIEKNSKQHITHYLMPISNNTKR